MDAKGQEVKAEIEALNNKEAISKIRNMGYFPTKVKAKGLAGKKVAKEAAAPKRRGSGGKVKVKYLTQFARQLSTLQDAGLSILRSLRSARTAAKRHVQESDRIRCRRYRRRLDAFRGDGQISKDVRPAVREYGGGGRSGRRAGS